MCSFGRAFFKIHFIYWVYRLGMAVFQFFKFNFRFGIYYIEAIE